MSCSSSSVGFWPSDLITIPSSFDDMEPSPFLSNSENASLNSVNHPVISTVNTRYGDTWRFGVVVNALVSINEVNLRRVRLVLGWVTVSGVQLPMRENLSQYITSHRGQLSLSLSLNLRAWLSSDSSMSCLNEYLERIYFSLQCFVT